MPEAKFNPVNQFHKDQKAKSMQKLQKQRKDSKHNFLKNQDHREMLMELADLDDMEFNPKYGSKAVERHKTAEWIQPGMHTERLADTAIKLKRERLNNRLDEMEKMYSDLKMETIVNDIKNSRQKYEMSRRRKSSFKDAIALAKNVKMTDIVMPEMSLEMELSQKSSNMDKTGGVYVPQGGNREAIEAATRAKNRLRGVPPPPTLTLPRSFKRFKSSKAPPPPPPSSLKKRKINNDGPDYTGMAPAAEFNYDLGFEHIAQSSNTFRPSGTKKAPPPPPRKGSDQPNTLKKETQKEISAKANVKYNTKAITHTEMTHFVPRNLVKAGNKDTITLKRNVPLPKPKPEATGDKDTDEYNQFLYEVDSLPSKSK